MKKRYFIVILGVIGLVCSCTFNEYVADELPPIEGPISYNSDIQPIFDSKCVACHGNAGQLNLEPENSYSNIVPDRVNVSNPDESLIYSKANPAGTDSHGTKYSSEEAQKVYIWIEDGAENN